MNERVGKLWDQAASECAYLRSGENSWDTQVRFIDKFAELIVRECAQLVKSTQLTEDGHTWRSADYVVLEHFGVEE